MADAKPAAWLKSDKGIVEAVQDRRKAVQEVLYALLIHIHSANKSLFLQDRVVRGVKGAPQAWASGTERIGRHPIVVSGCL